ncbi:unnamed protein product [Peniophora sp. CBMAI 1063]|nr:unnamed protein product [Peniophora sp. CBMAI 1063]
MSQTTNVFLTGAAGYLGGAILQLLMRMPNLAITALVRDEQKAAKLEQLGIETVIGSLDDAALMEAESAKADAIFQSAAYDHLNGVNALLRGAKARFERTGKQPIFIQTAGTAIFGKLDAMGSPASGPALSDMDPNLYDHKNALPYTAINDALIAADAEGFVRTYIVFPSVVYGTLKGLLVDAGIAHAYSLAIAVAVKLSIQRGQGAMVGPGLNRWSGAHVDDAADFYKIVFERALANDATHGTQGSYVLENCDFNYKDATERYTAILHAHGKSAKPGPEAFTAAEIEKNPMITLWGVDIRITGDRARALGWNPTHGVEEFFESVQEDTEAILAGKD